MKNKKTITPNEINKYVYCQYQWYYERKYGTKYLRELYNQKNKKLNLEDKLESNFKKGNNFHERYIFKQKPIPKISVIFILIIILCLIAYIFR